ncbi:MAG TPA: PAS domain S-box protein, partial [Nitrospirae bacterium]|nr:PAS domain S-box protein [Nitrospirota bacterium]
MNIEKDQFRKKIKIFSLFFAIPAVFLQIALLSFLIIHLLKHELVNYIEVATVLIIFSLTACFIVSFFYTINWFKKTLLKLITEYKALCKLHEQVLSEKDELIRKIIYATPVGLLLLERDNIKWCNDYALSLFGIKNNVDLNTIDINSFFKVSEGYKDIKHFFPSKLMEEELIKFDTLLINASGSTVDVHIEATALDKQLPLKGIVLSITDISWQKKAETELRQQLNFFQTLINTIPSPIFYKDSSFRFRGCNKEFEKFIGSKSEDIIGKTVYEITPKKYADIYNKADLELLEKGGTQTYESKIVYSDGSLHDVFFNKSVYFDAYGNKAGIIGIMLDITNIKRMETIISSQEVLYQRIFDESPLGKSMVNINNFKFIKVNNSLCSMLQYTRDELLNLTVFDVTHPDDTYISEKYIKGLLNGEYDYAYFEKRYIRKDGEIIWVKLNISLIEFGDEPSIYALNIIEDISLQKKALEDVRLFRNALDKAGESIFLINPYSMKVIDVNQRACLVYGYSKDELVNRDIKIICLDADNQIFSENIKTLLNEPEKVISFRTKNQRQNSTEFPVEISMSSTIFENRPIAVLTVRDITERNRLERELIITREKAIEASRLKSEFVANMSHEIRTPLNGIIGIIDLLAYSGLNNEQSNLLKTLKDSSNTLLGIINDILDFSKIEAGKLTIDHDLFETRELIENAVDVFSAKAYEKGLQLAVYIDKNIPSKLEGPQNRTKQILLNLINNAIKFTDEGYVLIEVNVEDEEDNFNKALGIVTLRFEITDTGIGMDEKTLSRIFQPFVQADSSSSRQHAGTGLGLYISKKLIELMGGDIKIESQFKKGSSFKFTIPFLIPKNRSEDELFCKILPFNTLIISDREQEALVILKYLNDMGMKS